jgi:hypothetical protein
VVHELLGVFDALGVVSDIGVDEGGVLVDLFEGGVGLVDLACEELAAGVLGEGVDELDVEEALVAGIGLLGALLELREGLGVEDRVVTGRGGTNGDTTKKKDSGQKKR